MGADAVTWRQQTRPTGVPGVWVSTPFDHLDAPVRGVSVYFVDLDHRIAAGQHHHFGRGVSVHEWALGQTACLSASERQRAARFVHADAGPRWAAAHVVLRTVLAHHVGCDPADLRFAQALGGKPHLVERAGPAPRFSLSHSGSYVLVAIVPASATRWDIGVDLEVEMSAQVAFDVSPTLHPRETAALSTLAPCDLASATTRVWVRKEALLKARGTGLMRDPSLDFVGAGSCPAPFGEGLVLVDLPSLPTEHPAHAASCAVALGDSGPIVSGGRSPVPVRAGPRGPGEV